MNINELMPKHINMEELAAQVPNYSGTFAEFADMLLNHEVTLVTDNEGNVIDFWVHASENPMLDALIGQKFSMAYLFYGMETIMKWVAMIIKAKQAGLKIEDIDEEAGTCKIGGATVQFAEPREDEEEDEDDEEYEEEEEEEGLPEHVKLYLTDLDYLAGYIVDYDDEADLQKWVKRYLRQNFEHCLARGSHLDIEVDLEDEDLVKVSGIEWGRALTEKELENLNY